MRDQIELSPRLMAVASFVRHDSVIADIGTDHAYLPIYLVKNNMIRGALACDLREGPLQKAKENIEQFNLGAFIRIRTSDGLQNVDSNEADDIVISGMGGELIWDIIQKTKWLFHGKKHLILQPMTNESGLRKQLMENRFRIDREKVVTEGRYIYLVLSAVYDGKVQQTDKASLILGNMKYHDPEEKAYLAREITRLKNQKKGLINQHKEQDVALYNKLIEFLEKKLEEPQ